MSKYTIIVKKGDIVLEVSTPNKNFIEKEFAKWVLTAADVEKKQQKTEEISTLVVKKDFIKPNNPIKKNDSNEIQNISKENFEKVLSQKVSEMPVQSKEERLEKFKKKQSQSEIDAFMQCVYELSEKEKMERFSFSQINVLAEEQFGTSFNYEIIQKAIDLNYIRIVPDYTGMANVVEYAVDIKGERYLKNVLK